MIDCVWFNGDIGGEVIFGICFGYFGYRVNIIILVGFLIEIFFVDFYIVGINYG